MRPTRPVSDESPISMFCWEVLNQYLEPLDMNEF